MSRGNGEKKQVEGSTNIKKNRERNVYSMSKKVTWQQEANIAVVTIDNPPANALSADVAEQLFKCLKEIEAVDDIRVVVLAGAGDKFFMAGADITEFPELVKSTSGFVAENTRKLHNVFNYLDFFHKPVVVAVQGFALGGGCELMMCGDLCIASENAQFGLPEINLGLFPGGGGTQRLSRRVGEIKAKELMFLGHFISAEEALRIGLINVVVPAGQVLEEAKKVAAKI
jgi:enoyl-CoA hydratase